MLQVFVTLTVSNATVIIPAIARTVSDSETYHETNNVASRTFNGGERKRVDNATMLSTLRIVNMTSTAAPHDDSDEENQSRSIAWESKDQVTDDGGSVKHECLTVQPSQA